MKIGYARVSTKDQDLSLQIDALRRTGCTRIYQEQISGTTKERPELQKMLEQLREGDGIFIWKLDWLARSLKDLIGLVKERTNAGLAAARARGRKGGRPKGLSKKAKHTAIIAERLYQERELTISEICDQLSITKMTLYNYLRFRGVEIGATHRK